MSHSIEHPPNHLFFDDDGQTPNSRLPVLLYRNVALKSADKARASKRCSTPITGRLNGGRWCSIITITTRPRMRCWVYPKGQEKYDIQRPEPTTHDQSVARIAKVPLPLADPVYGGGGALMGAWRAR